MSPPATKTNTTTTTTTVSAPGKILLAGGYVVLEAPNPGVVLAVDKRFYSTVEKEKNMETTEKDADGEPAEKKPKVESAAAAATTTATASINITVHSPQFGATWKYQASTATSNNSNNDDEDDDSDDDSNSNAFSLTLTANPTNASSNSFVEKTLRVTLAYLLLASQPQQHSKCYKLTITILANNDFYSVAPHLQARNWDATPKHLAQLPQFLPCQNSGNGLQKTGLGSSATLVTSLVGALVMSLSNDNTNNNNSISTQQQRCIHNLAQICHCHAQGKVGSGFDVSSATYGSHVYQRFPKSLLSGLLQDLEEDEDNKRQQGMVSSTTIRTMQNLVTEQDEEHKWTGGCLQALPWNTELLQVMLADVSGGSESPSMACKILSWKGRVNNDITCWNHLVKGNTHVVKILEQIVATLPSDDNKIRDLAQRFSQFHFTTADDDDQTKEEEALHLCLCLLRKVLNQNRASMKQMGKLAGIPVEPDEQTALADATKALPGVVAALVPGAGGYDALAVVYINTAKVQSAICDLWRTYQPLQVCPLAVQYAKYGEGVQLEPMTPQYQQQ